MEFEPRKFEPRKLQFYSIWLNHLLFDCGKRWMKFLLNPIIKIYNNIYIKDWSEMNLEVSWVGHFTTISGHFLANYLLTYVKNSHKTEVLTVILKCLLNLFKSSLNQKLWHKVNLFTEFVILGKNPSLVNERVCKWVPTWRNFKKKILDHFSPSFLDQKW